MSEDYNLDYIRRRCSGLVEAGLLQRVHADSALWSLTERGHAYLDEEYDVAAGMYLDEKDGESGFGADGKA